MRWLLVVCGATLSGCCSEMGCSALLTITLDRALAGDAVVSVDLDGAVTDCFAADESSGYGGCQHRLVDGVAVITMTLGSDAPSDVAAVRISEGGAPSVEHAVPLTADEPYYPNGKRCGTSCTSVTGTLVLPASCEDEPVDACPADRCQVVTGARLDVPGECIAERQSFCLAGTDVDELETVATDLEGSRWLFGNTTIPEGWTAVDMDPAETGASTWADCAP